MSDLIVPAFSSAISASVTLHMMSAMKLPEGILQESNIPHPFKNPRIS